MSVTARGTARLMERRLTSWMQFQPTFLPPPANLPLDRVNALDPTGQLTVDDIDDFRCAGANRGGLIRTSALRASGASRVVARAGR